MEQVIKGKAFVVGDDVDTDQIIPARHLAYNPADPQERKYFGRYAMSGVPAGQSGLPEGNVPFVRQGQFTSDYAVVIAGRNFGCGSSREHAPLALAEAGVTAVVAQSYARLFYRNSVNGAHLLPLETPVRLVEQFRTADPVEIDTRTSRLTNLRTGQVFGLLPLGEAGPILTAGGLFPYARREGMLK
jgi:3-isopropylmalate/(R)-2-methylmalate dehydratase small subunit